MIINAILLALRQIRRNFLRAFLTMLGIIIGVGAVVVMISFGNGVTKQTGDRFASLGKDIVLVFPARVTSPGGGNLRRSFNKQELQEVISGTKEFAITIAPIASGASLVQFNAKNTTTQIQGIDSNFFIATEWEVAQGRAFKDIEYETGANACLIGQSVRNNLFSELENPLGKKIRLSNIVCECVGVLESKGQGGFGNDQDDVLLVPLKTYSRSITRSNTLNSYDRLMIKMRDDVDSATAMTTLSQTLKKARKVKDGEQDSFEIRDSKQIAEAFQSSTKTMTIFLGFIAGVSLLVGGIGIMNIMLVSVTERTKEIGTRMAIGALESEVLMQFLVESVTLSSLGGIIGIAWAFFASLGVSAYWDIPFIFDVPTAIIAFVFSAFIGIFFGYVPARRASKLNPIDALRHE